MKASIENEKGMILIWFYLLIAILTVTGASLYGLSFQESQLLTIDQTRDKAFYVAEAGLDQKLQELKIGILTPATDPAFGEGSYEATFCPSTPSLPLPPPQDCPAVSPCQCDEPDMIISIGTIPPLSVNGISKTVKAVVQKESPPGVPAAISSLGDISFNGNITVDGRDHDSSGALTAGPGVYGASSNGEVDQGGSASIDGDPQGIQENASNVFTTPEEVLGLSPGSLDQIKTSTPPATPFKDKIVYLTADYWNSPDFGTESDPSTGILIVHNSDGDAQLRNVHGYFKGIIIADDLVHINGDAVILGALVLQNSSGNAVGNGAAHINYSSEVLNNLPAGPYTVVSWEDTQNAAYAYS